VSRTHAAALEHPVLLAGFSRPAIAPGFNRGCSPRLRPLLFTFHLSPGLAQRVIDTLPKPSAHTLAIWQTAHGAIQTRLLSAKRAHTWQAGKLVIPQRHGPFYQTRAIPREKRHFCMTSNSHLAPVPVHSVWQTSPPHRTRPLARSLARPTLFRSIMKRFGRRPVFLAPAERAAG